ncbi:tetratricopeptide repeat protein [Alphaproteobacteria bacterium]|nr:tetratricopeptide repeat protein [Alphaproteobacteria bacterium]
MNVYNPQSVKLQPDNSNILESAIELHANGDLLTARNLYEAVLAGEPQNLTALHMSGMLAYQEGRLDTAASLFHRTSKLSPYFAEPFFYRGLVLSSLNRQNEAVDSFNSAIFVKSDFGEAYFHKALALVELGDLENAQLASENATKYCPDNAVTFFNLGKILTSRKMFNQAASAYNQALEIDPNYVHAILNLANIKSLMGLDSEAIVQYERAVSIDQDCYAAIHMLAALKGEVTQKAPRLYVENLFNNYARTFDQDLVNNLEYKVPTLIGDLVRQLSGRLKFTNVLDLGCGTGLVGKEIKKYCDNIVGVDISSEMLLEAEKKCVYSNLEHCEIIDYLRKEPVNSDLFIMADVFIYIGNLSELFSLISKTNKKPVKLIFTTENSEGSYFSLEKTGRYSHSRVYINDLCESFNLTITSIKDIQIRKEANASIMGSIYVAEI